MCQSYSVRGYKLRFIVALSQKLEVGPFNVDFRATNEAYELARHKLTRKDLKSKKIIWELPRS